MHHRKSVVEAAEEEVEAVAVEAVVEAVEAVEAVAEAVEEDHLMVNPLHKPPHLLRPLTTMAED